MTHPCDSAYRIDIKIHPRWHPDYKSGIKARAESAGISPRDSSSHFHHITTTDLRNLPSELLMATFEAYMDEHRRVLHNRMPKNEHLPLMRTCRRFLEHSAILSCYLSLYDDQVGARLWHTEHCEGILAKVRQIEVVAVSIFPSR